MTDSGTTIGSSGLTGSTGSPTTPTPTSTSTGPPASGSGAGSKTEQVKAGAAKAAHDLRGEAASTVSDVAGEASSQLGHVKDEAVAKAGDLLHQTREQVTTQADQGTHQLAESLVAAGRELTTMAERSDQDGPMTTLVRQIGARATDMGQRFQQGGYRALSRDVTGFARTSPGLFLLAAAGAGFAVGRVVRNADTKAIADAARQSGDDPSERSEPSGQWSGGGAVDPQRVAMPADLDVRDRPEGMAAPVVPLGVGGAAGAAGGSESWSGSDMPTGAGLPLDAEPDVGATGERF